MTSPSRQAISDLWHLAAQVSRQHIFGATDSLRPHYDEDGPTASQIDVPALGTVGRGFHPTSVTFVSVNPAGGTSNSRSTLVDKRLYEAFANMRSVANADSRLEAFEHVTTCFEASVPTWTIWWQYIEPILVAVDRSFGSTAYLYLVPFRTQGDAGSSMPDVFIRAAYEKHLKQQLNLLSPKLIIAVDRPSERICGEWSRDNGNDAEVFYFTRKRDAHAERKRLLAQLKARRRA
ncbi:MAG: hypothetical protein AB7T20_12010 [Steroidobacteraceae bacterium]